MATIQSTGEPVIGQDQSYESVFQALKEKSNKGIKITEHDFTWSGLTNTSPRKPVPIISTYKNELDSKNGIHDAIARIKSRIKRHKFNHDCKASIDAYEKVYAAITYRNDYHQMSWRSGDSGRKAIEKLI